MPEQERGEGANEGSQQPETPAAEPQEAPAGRPARAERGAAKAAVKEPPPPGSIADLIRAALPDVALEAYQGLSSVIVEVTRDAVANVMPVLKDDPRLDLRFLRVLFGVDHGEEGMEVVYQLLSLEKNHEVTVKARLPREDLRVASVTSVWNAANWHERETRDMFGIQFEGHPHLVPLLLPEDMTDHFPLRKDSPLAEIEEWQAELLGEAAGEGDEETEE
jgi:NADH-quinone oxidoreductase subunit C